MANRVFSFALSSEKGGLIQPPSSLFMNFELYLFVPSPLQCPKPHDFIIILFFSFNLTLAQTYFISCFCFANESGNKGWKGERGLRGRERGKARPRGSKSAETATSFPPTLPCWFRFEPNVGLKDMNPFVSQQQSFFFSFFGWATCPVDTPLAVCATGVPSK